MNTISLDQITGSNFAYNQLPFEQFLDDMVELGRTHVELWGVAPHLHIPETSPADVRRIRGQLRERELSVACITPEQVMYPVNIASAEPWLREASIAMFKKAADVCVELESPLLFLTPGRGYENEPVEHAWQRSVDSLGEITQYAGSLGLTCVFEPLQRVESNLVNNTSDISRMLADVAAPNMGVALDTVAMAVAGESVADYFAAFGSLVTHVHLIDGKPAGHLAWGDGELPLASYLSELGEAGYSGFLTFELFGNGNYAIDPLPVLRKCLAEAETVITAPATTR